MAIAAIRQHASSSIGRREGGTLVTYERPPDRSRISRVRASFIAILVLLGALPAAADVIRLKNGRTIWADQVRQNKDRVEYDVGEDTYAIPKSSVDRIDAGGMAPARSGSSHDVPDFTPPTPSFSHEADVSEKIIRDGKVDADALSALEREGRPEFAAAGYFLAGKHETDHGNFPQSPSSHNGRAGISTCISRANKRRKASVAICWQRSNPTMTTWCAIWGTPRTTRSWSRSIPSRHSSM